MTRKRTDVDTLFAVLPGPSEDHLSIEDLYERFPDWRPQKLYTTLHALHKEGSMERIGPRNKHAYRKATLERFTREYVPKQPVAYREPAGPNNPVLAEALAEAERRHGKIQTVAQQDEDSAATLAAQSFMDFAKATTALEARMYRLMKDNEALRAERDRYANIVRDIQNNLSALTHAAPEPEPQPKPPRSNGHASYTSHG